MEARKGPQTEDGELCHVEQTVSYRHRVSVVESVGLESDRLLLCSGSVGNQTLQVEAEPQERSWGLTSMCSFLCGSGGLFHLERVDFLASPLNFSKLSVTCIESHEILREAVWTLLRLFFCAPN